MARLLLSCESSISVVPTTAQLASAKARQLTICVFVLGAHPYEARELSHWTRNQLVVTNFNPGLSIGLIHHATSSWIVIRNW